MSRLPNGKKNSTPNIDHNSESNEENFFVHSQSEEQDSPRMGDLQGAFENLTLAERRRSRQLRASVRTNEVDENIEVTTKNNKMKETNEIHPDLGQEKLLVSEKLRALSKADSSIMEKQKSTSEAQASTAQAEVAQKNSRRSSSEKKNLKRKSISSRSADPFARIKEGGKSSIKKSIVSINSNSQAALKTIILTESPTINNQIPTVSTQSTRRSIVIHNNLPILTAATVNCVNPTTIKIEETPARPYIRNETTNFEWIQDKNASWQKINRTEVATTMSSQNNNAKISKFTISSVPGPSTSASIKSEEFASPQVNSPTLPWIKRENLMPQSPIASVVVTHVTPPTISTRPMNAIVMNKYEESTVHIPAISNNNPDFTREPTENSNFRSASVNSQVMTAGFKKWDGCSEKYHQLGQHSSKKPLGGKLKVIVAGPSKPASSSETDHRRQRKEKKVAKAFETFATRFVTTAVKMGYLSDECEYSSATSIENSEHSLDCSCSSCSSYSSCSDDSELSIECSCSSCAGTSSDNSTECSVSGSSNTIFSDSSTSISDMSSSDTD